MLKKALASLAALVASSPAAFAGPYVNYETNVSFAGSDTLQVFMSCTLALRELLITLTTTCKQDLL